MNQTIPDEKIKQNTVVPTEEILPKKKLVIKLFGKQRNFGAIEPRNHNDVASVIEFLRRGRNRYTSKLSRERVLAAEDALEKGSIFKSFDEVSARMQLWKEEHLARFEAESYYDRDRSSEYHNHNSRGSQTNLACAAIGMMEAIGKDTSGTQLVLDLGAGTGLSSLGMTSCRSEWHVIGLDASSHMLERVHENKKPPCLDTIHADMSQPLPFRTGVFDSCASVAALHYILEPAGGRNELDRVKTCSKEVLRCLEMSPHSSRNKSTQGSSIATAAFQLFPSKPEKLELLNPTALLSDEHSSACLIMDQPHQNNKPRWYYCLSKRDKAIPSTTNEMCPLYWNNSWPSWSKPTCTMLVSSNASSYVLDAWKRGEKNEANQLDKVDQHLNWIAREHVKFARKLLRTFRHIETSDVDAESKKRKFAQASKSGPTLSTKELSLAKKLSDRFVTDGSVPSLEELSKSIVTVCELLHQSEE